MWPAVPAGHFLRSCLGLSWRTGPQLADREKAGTPQGNCSHVETRVPQAALEAGRSPCPQGQAFPAVASGQEAGRSSVWAQKPQDPASLAGGALVTPRPGSGAHRGCQGHSAGMEAVVSARRGTSLSTVSNSPWQGLSPHCKGPAFCSLRPSTPRRVVLKPTPHFTFFLFCGKKKKPKSTKLIEVDGGM